MLEVGSKYFSPRMEVWVNIIHKLPNGDLPFVGMTDDMSSIIQFDLGGRDKWFECGGCWYKLDLTTKKPATIRITV